jgi:predicted ATPase/DNA-binding CsgD family transcriptional regulator
MSPLIGREAEQLQILARLGDPRCRLLTILGVGGVGKTRLALQIAQQVAEQTVYRDGVFLVPLGAQRASEAVDDVLAAAVLAALEVALAGPEPPALQLRHYLRGRQALVLLDNFEHLAGAAGYLAALLEHAPGLTLLVTSRQRLNIRGEWAIELAGLSLPAPGEALDDMRAAQRSGALAMFAHVARMHMPAFELVSANLADVARICQLCAGLPLAIELAASWVRSLSCPEIADEIGRSFDFLAASTHDMPARQRSLRAVFVSSWNLLAADQQQALRRLSVFHGSFTREAAAAVAGVSLAMLAALADQSLVRRAAGPAGPARFELLEVVRQYAGERLERSGEAEALGGRYADHYLRWLAARREELRGGGQQAALQAVSLEMAHVRAAWAWAVARTEIGLLALAGPSLFHVYDMRSWFAEGLEAYRSATNALAARQGEPPVAPVYAMLLARQGWLTCYLGQQREAKALLARSLAIARAHGALDETVFALNYLAATCSYLGEYEQMQAYGQESLALSQQCGAPFERAITCNILGQAAYEQGRYELAQAYSQQSLRLEQQLGNRWSMAFSLMNLGKVAFITGAYAEARWFFDESLQIRQAMGDLRGVAGCLSRLGETAVVSGERSEARRNFEHSLALFRSIGDQWGSVVALTDLGQLALAEGQAQDALALLQTALQAAMEIDALPQIVTILASCAPLVRRIGEAAWADALDATLAQASAAPEQYRQHATRLLAVGDTSRLAGASAPARPERRAQPQPDTRAGLTARELDVLRLVASGMTDAQVAARLALSPRTVSTHLSSIYGKLQVNSRSAATRFAVEHRLAP